MPRPRPAAELSRGDRGDRGGRAGGGAGRTPPSWRGASAAVRNAPAA